MAEYKAPENPQRTRRNRNDSFDWVPLVGLLLGLIVTVVALFVAFQMATRFLETAPLDVALPTPTIIQLTAPASATPEPAAVEATPEPLPSPTLAPTRAAEGDDEAEVPEALVAGLYAQVTDTGGAGLSVRGGPSTDNIKLLVVEENAVVLLVEGPTEGSGLTWWKILIDDGTEGWVAAQFLTPAASPSGENE